MGPFGDLKKNNMLVEKRALVFVVVLGVRFSTFSLLMLRKSTS